MSLHTEKLKRLENLLKGSRLTEKDAEIIAEKVKTGIARRQGIKI